MKGGEIGLLLTPSQMDTILARFDSYCRKVLRGECRNYLKQLSKLSEKESYFSELTEEQLNRLYILDQYPLEQYHFQVQGYDVTVQDERIASGLETLSNEKRDIVLLSYFLEMTDQEIADKLNAIRGTIQYRRTKALKEMKQKMEAEKNGETTSQ